MCKTKTRYQPFPCGGESLLADQSLFFVTAFVISSSALAIASAHLRERERKQEYGNSPSHLVDSLVNWEAFKIQ